MQWRCGGEGWGDLLGWEGHQLFPWKPKPFGCYSETGQLRVIACGQRQVGENIKRDGGGKGGEPWGFLDKEGLK